MKDRVDAYMTVEASLVMSVVLMVYLFIIQYALWSYDRCVLEQDMAALLLRCAGAEELERVWQQEKNGWDREKYIWIQAQEPVLEKDLLTLTITGQGKGGELEDMGIRYEMWSIKPQEWLRTKRKVARGLNKEEGEYKE